MCVCVCSSVSVCAHVFESAFICSRTDVFAWQDMGTCAYVHVCARACLNDSECNIEHMYNQNILLSAVDTLPRAWSECVCCS